MRGVVLLALLTAACGRADAPANRQADVPPAPSAAAALGDVSAAERQVRRRLNDPAGLTFSDPYRTASEGVTIICGRYAQGRTNQRYIVVDGNDVFLEPELQPGEMDRYFAEYCGGPRG